jgi:hypothetical protein
MRLLPRIAALVTLAALLTGCGAADEPRTPERAARDGAATETVFDDMIEQKDAVAARVEAAQEGHRQQLEQQLSHDEGANAPAADSEP